MLVNVDLDSDDGDKPTFGGNYVLNYFSELTSWTSSALHLFSSQGLKKLALIKATLVTLTPPTSVPLESVIAAHEHLERQCVTIREALAQACGKHLSADALAAWAVAEEWLDAHILHAAELMKEHNEFAPHVNAEAGLTAVASEVWTSKTQYGRGVTDAFVVSSTTILGVW